MGNGDLMAPSLPDLTSGESILLTSDNIIKREAFRFKHLASSIEENGILALNVAYFDANGGRDELARQIEISRRLLRDHSSNNSNVEGLKAPLGNLLNIFESYIPYMADNDWQALTNLYFRRLCEEQGEYSTAKLIKEDKIDFFGSKDEQRIFHTVDDQRVQSCYAMGKKFQQEALGTLMKRI